MTTIETQHKDTREQKIRAMLIKIMRANTNRLGGHQVVLFGCHVQGKASLTRYP